MLGRMPLRFVPAGETWRVQPVDVNDLADAALAVLEADTPDPVCLDLVGPVPMTFDALLDHLGHWAGGGGVLKLPVVIEYGLWPPHSPTIFQGTRSVAMPWPCCAGAIPAIPPLSPAGSDGRRARLMNPSPGCSCPRLSAWVCAWLLTEYLCG